jgi:DNA-binding transcriptional regulator YhcF (GntR family)
MSESELPIMQQRVLAFAKLFLEDEDQFPPLQATAKRFGIRFQTAANHYKRLEQSGFIERNCVGKWRFKREGEQE